MKNDYKELVSILVEKLNGVENVQAATHCVSRLRLVLKNYNEINISEIEKLNKVKGVFKVNGQLHIIFGQEVNEIYKEFMNFPGMNNKSVSTTTIKKIGVEKQNFLKRSMNHLSELFMPLIPILVAGGLILGLRNILETEWTDGVSAVLKVPFFKGLNDFLWIPASAVFWFLPVFICYSVFKKMNGSQVLGILLGLSLLVSMPSIYDLNNAINDVNNGTTSGQSGQNVGWWLITDFFTKSPEGFHFAGWGPYPIKVGYTSQVIPAIGVAFLGVYTERLLIKWTKPMLRQIVVPLVTVLFCYTMAMLVIGPIGFVVGTTISIIISLALTNNIAKYITAPIFGFVYSPLVITGLHHTLNAVMVQNTGTLGGSLFFPILALSNICQGAACLMYGIMNRKDDKIKQVAYSATASAWLAVTEPALYGVNLKKSYIFLSACIGSAIASTLAIAAGVTSNGIGNGAWLGTITIQPNSPIAGVYTWPGTGWTWFLISGIIGTVVSMSLTFLFSKTKFDLFYWFKNKFSKKQSKQNNNIANITQNVLSIGKGEVYSLDSIKDETFNKKILGDGVAIDILDGKVYSPIDGTIDVIAETKHAYAITSDDKVSILIHIGVDTVNLDCQKIFKTNLVQGQKIQKGDLICKFNRKAIIKSKLEHRVIFLVTNESSKKISKTFENKVIKNNDIVFELE